jgi:hypothetical protein
MSAIGHSRPGRRMSDPFNQALNAGRHKSSAGRSAGNAQAWCRVLPPHRSNLVVPPALLGPAYVHDRKPKPPPLSFVHSAKRNQSDILPVYGAERGGSAKAGAGPLVETLTRRVCHDAGEAKFQKEARKGSLV